MFRCFSWAGVRALASPPAVSSPASNMASQMESTMGTISAMAAVLEIHIDRNIVTSMKPDTWDLR